MKLSVSLLLFAAIVSFSSSSRAAGPYSSETVKVEKPAQLGSFVSSHQLRSESQASFREMIESMPLFSRPVGDSVVRFKSFLLDETVPVTFKVNSIRSWIEIEELRAIVQESVLHPPATSGTSRSLRSSLSRQGKKVRHAISLLILSLDSAGSSTQFLQRFSQALVDPVSDSERNLLLIDLLKLENSRNQNTWTAKLAEIFSRHPITIGLQAVFGAMLITTAIQRGVTEHDLSNLMVADLAFSAGFLFLEFGMKSDIDTRVANRNRVRAGTETAISILANAESFVSSFKPAPDLESAMTAYIRDASSKANESFILRMSPLKDEVKALADKLITGDQTELVPLKARVDAAQAKLVQVTQYARDMEAHFDLASDIEDIYTAGRYLKYYEIYQKIKTGGAGEANVARV